MKKHRVLAEARQEFADALRWYRGKAPAFAEALTLEYRTIVHRACQFPDAGAVEAASESMTVRRQLLHQFPDKDLPANLPDDGEERPLRQLGALLKPTCTKGMASGSYRPRGVAVKPLPKDFPLDRTKAFCDGVFAIVITLLVLGISVPEQADPSGEALLVARSEFWHEVLVYFVGFWFVALYWSQHSLLLEAVQRVDRGLITLNLSFLVPVTLLPFVTQLMGARQHEWEVVLLFALTNLVAAFLFREMWKRIEDRPEFHKSIATVALAGRIRQGMRLFFAIMILGVLVALYNVKAGIVLFLVVPLFYFYNYVRDPLASS